MSKTVRFFLCSHCGNIIAKIKDSGVPVECCGEYMKELVSNTIDASLEKHVPVIDIDGNKITVKVGSVPHPMESGHYIEWIYILTENGGQYKELKPGDLPEAEFSLTGDKIISVYEYCNKHGLWKKDC